jgi:Fe-S-cluster containining protein
MAAHMQITIQQFIDVYTRTPEIREQADAGDLWLYDKPGPDGECILLENNLCRVHPEKPVQCVGFPMKWRTPDVMEYCEGMRR